MSEPGKTTWWKKITGGAVPLSCYGKLPFYRDFITVDGGQKVCAQFRRWLDAAFGKRWEDLDSKGEELDGPRRILFVPARSQEVALGSVWNSHDEGGLRRFPFAFFVPLPARKINPAGDGFLRDLVPLWTSMEERFHTLGGYGNVADFYSDYRGLVLAPDQENGGERPPGARQTRAADLHAALRESGPDSGGLLGTAWMAARACRWGLEGGRELEAIRFPLVSSMDSMLQAETWVRFLARNAPDLPVPLNLVLPQEAGSEGTFTVVLRPLTAPDARLLSPRAAKAEGVLDLADRDRRDDAKMPAKYVERLKARLKREDFTLDKFAGLRISRRALKREG